jgi:hypothetical protein
MTQFILHENAGNAVYSIDVTRSVADYASHDMIFTYFKLNSRQQSGFTYKQALSS